MAEQVTNGDHVAMRNCKYPKCKLIAKYLNHNHANMGMLPMARTLKNEDKDHFFIATAILNEPPIIVEREEKQFASQQHTVICRVHLNFKKVSGVLKVTHGSI